MLDLLRSPELTPILFGALVTVIAFLFIVWLVGLPNVVEQWLVDVGILERPPQPETYIEWIKAYIPSLQPGAKAVYVVLATRVAHVYHVERIAPTTNKLLLKRRASESVKEIEEVQYALFEQYKRLAEAQPQQDDLPPFALMPLSRNLHSAFVDVHMNLRPYMPWRYVPQVTDEQKQKLSTAQLDVLKDSPLAHVALMYL